MVDVATSSVESESDPSSSPLTQEVGTQASPSRINARIQAKPRTSSKGEPLKLMPTTLSKS